MAISHKKKPPPPPPVNFGSILPTWNRNVFMSIAADRGYISEVHLVRDIADRLNLATSQVRKMLNTGRFTWERLLILGAMLEMTPREFCGCFLDGYFREDTQGHFIAMLDEETSTAMANLIPKTIHSKTEWERFFEEKERADD